MYNKEFSNIEKLTISGIVIALYCVIMYITQGFAFGQYQIRIATSMYALAYFFPFLILPLGIANFISNALFGGLGIVDMVGGFIVGIVVTAIIVFIKKKNLSSVFVSLPIIIIPGTFVPIWLSTLIKVPYMILLPSILIGQIIPAIVGVMMISAFKKTILRKAGI